jgi:hypothetical protein
VKCFDAYGVAKPLPNGENCSSLAARANNKNKGDANIMLLVACRHKKTAMSALGQKQTCAVQKAMSALASKADM